VVVVVVVVVGGGGGGSGTNKWGFCKWGFSWPAKPFSAGWLL